MCMLSPFLLCPNRESTCSGMVCDSLATVRIWVWHYYMHTFVHSQMGTSDNWIFLSCPFVYSPIHTMSYDHAGMSVTNKTSSSYLFSHACHDWHTWSYCGDMPMSRSFLLSCKSNDLCCTAPCMSMSHHLFPGLVTNKRLTLCCFPFSD